MIDVMENYRSAPLMRPLSEQPPPLAHQPMAQENVANLAPDLIGNRFVNVTISSQAGGLSIVVNLNPEEDVDLNGAAAGYDRPAPRKSKLPVELMALELRKALQIVHLGQLRLRPTFQSMPPELLKLRHVALTGDGDPTSVSNFAEAIQAVTWLRALGEYFKIVLITKGTCVHHPEVLQGIESLTKSDEIWFTLDASSRMVTGKSEHIDASLERIFSNILLIGRKRPVVIQSSFPLVKGQEQPLSEIQKYVLRLNELKEAGAQISQVQIYSGNAAVHARSGHLSLRVLSQIAQSIRQTTGLRVEVF
jgi:wyosine [tRNA(Phe)-imidazoG37] synthetase (radical SAM superfamily)